jgi:hypothetical protein
MSAQSDYEVLEAIPDELGSPLLYAKHQSRVVHTRQFSLKCESEWIPTLIFYGVLEFASPRRKDLQPTASAVR